MNNIDFEKLYNAYLECRKNKRTKKSSAEFEFNLEKELFDLMEKLNNQTYTLLPSNSFVVTEPKIREIFAAQFSDRVVHHLIVDYIKPIFEPKFIFDSFANRDGKGTHLAIRRVQKFSRKVTQNNKIMGYYLQADIKNFFMSINHQILFNLIKPYVKDPFIIYLIKTLIFTDCTQNAKKVGNLSLFDEVPPQKSLFTTPKGQGLPIGNLTSQFFANIYLNELDQYVKHTLKCEYYARYVDDFVILDKDSTKLWHLLNDIGIFLDKKLKLQLHPQKCKVHPISSGIDFLGYIVRPNYVLVRKRVLNSLILKLHEFQKELDADIKEQKFSKFDWDYAVACINSYYAHFSHAQSYHLRKNLWGKHFGILKEYLTPVKNFGYFEINVFNVARATKGGKSS